MPVTFDAAGPSSAGASSTSSRTLAWTHPTGAAGRVILAGISCDAPSDAGWTVACTAAGTAMTALGGLVHAAGATTGLLAVFGILSVASGTIAMSCTVSGGSIPGDMEGGSLSFTSGGAAAFGTPVTGSGTSTTPSVSVAANTSGNLIGAFIACGDSVSTATSPSTSRFIINKMTSGGNGTGNAAGETAPATGSAVSMAWTINSAPYAVIAVEVQDTGGAAAGLLPQQLAHRQFASRTGHTRTGGSYAR